MDSPERAVERIQLLSSLWLQEPDSGLVARASSLLGTPHAEPAELAQAYADTVVLNVPPYGSTFTDAAAEMNGVIAQRCAEVFDAFGFDIPGRLEVGAQDHVGLCLGFMAHMMKAGWTPDAPPDDSAVTDWPAEFVHWLPIWSIAVAREPWAHDFYRELARVSCENAFASGWPFASSRLRVNLETESDHTELTPATLADADFGALLDFFTIPAQCGMLLTRSRMGHLARQLNVRIAFGPRRHVLDSLFGSLAAEGRTLRLIGALRDEARDWLSAVEEQGRCAPQWSPFADMWRDKLRRCIEVLDTMQAATQQQA